MPNETFHAAARPTRRPERPNTLPTPGTPPTPGRLPTPGTPPTPGRLPTPGTPSTPEAPAPLRPPPLPAPPPPDASASAPGSLPDHAPLRVVVADDNPVVRAGLTALLSDRDDLDVVAAVADGREAYDATVRLRPDVVLLDVRMPGVDGLSALPHLTRIAPVMMLTYSRESDIVHEALRRGACGYLVHGEFTADQLVEAVHDTKRGRPHLTATATNALLAEVRRTPPPPGQRLPEGLGAAQPADDLPRGGHDASRGLSHLQPAVAQSATDGASARVANGRSSGLSSREVEVMDLIASGMSNQQIAATCFISEKTVKNHINRIFGKLHSASRSEAIARWLGTTPITGPGGVGARGRG
ncbi:response regulator [Streptomyces sp. DT171]|uniref:response regulator n=1 Tax=Streptomyces sp. DT171 TaxID=3416524 RepID=UPI003CEB06CE